MSGGAGICDKKHTSATAGRSGLADQLALEQSRGDTGMDRPTWTRRLGVGPRVGGRKQHTAWEEPDELRTLDLRSLLGTRGRGPLSHLPDGPCGSTSARDAGITGRGPYSTGPDIRAGVGAASPFV